MKEINDSIGFTNDIDETNDQQPVYAIDEANIELLARESFPNDSILRAFAIANKRNEANLERNEVLTQPHTMDGGGVKTNIIPRLIFEPMAQMGLVGKRKRRNEVCTQI